MLQTLSSVRLSPSVALLLQLQILMLLAAYLSRPVAPPIAVVDGVFAAAISSFAQAADTLGVDGQSDEDEDAMDPVVVEWVMSGCSQRVNMAVVAALRSHASQSGLQVVYGYVW